MYGLSSIRSSNDIYTILKKIEPNTYKEEDRKKYVNLIGPVLSRLTKSGKEVVRVIDEQGGKYELAKK